MRDFILGLIFPIECLGCGHEGDFLCSQCFKNLRFKDEQACPGCKKVSKFAQTCRACQDGINLDGLWIAGHYEDNILSNLIKFFKYRFNKNLEPILSLYLCLFLRDLITKSRLKISNEHLSRGGVWKTLEKIKKEPSILTSLTEAIIIPVPLHKKRLRWRGFNQAELLAKSIANKFNLKIYNSLIRAKHKKAQAKLDEKHRIQNIKDCFIWTGDNLNQQNIILVDDVATTCSTLNECARILKNNGAREVWGLVIARG